MHDNIRTLVQDNDDKVIFASLSSDPTDAVALPANGAILTNTWWNMVKHFAMRIVELNTAYVALTGSPFVFSFNIATASAEEIEAADEVVLQLIQQFTGKPIQDVRDGEVFRNGINTNRSGLPIIEG